MVQRVARNTGIIMVGDVIFRLISLIVIIYLARYLGTAGFGKYSFVFAYLSFFGVITDLGLQIILVRDMSRDPSTAPKLIGNAYIIRSILTVFAITLSMIIISLTPYPPDIKTYVYLATFTLLFMSFSDFYATIFQANLRMDCNIIAKLVFKVLSASLIFWIVFTNGTLMQVLIALVFSEIVKMLINYLLSRKFVRPQFEIDFGLWKYLFKEALPFAFTSVITTIYYRIDVIMLSLMMGDTTVGLYSAAQKLCEPLLLIPTALMSSMFPIMSKAFISSKERLIKSYELSIKYLLIITLPIAIGTTIIADKIIFLIYGVEFAGSASALQILIWALVFASTSSVLTHLLASIEKQKLYIICTGLCAIVNMALNFILIPILSYNGAAIATVATNVALLITTFYFVSKHLQFLHIHRIFVKPTISGLIMGAFVYYFINVNIFLLVLLATAIYSAALLALRVFTGEDFNIAKRVIGKR